MVRRGAEYSTQPDVCCTQGWGSGTPPYPPHTSGMLGWHREIVKLKDKTPKLKIWKIKFRTHNSIIMFIKCTFIRYTSVKCTPVRYIHACEMHACEMYVCKMYTCEMHACEVHICEVHVCKMYTYKMHACK